MEANLKRLFVLQRCGVQSDELGKVLRVLTLKKNRLIRLMPLLEFITWSLLKEGSTVRNLSISTESALENILKTIHVNVETLA